MSGGYSKRLGDGMVYVLDGRVVDIEQEIASGINHHRLSGGLGPPIWSPELTGVARRFSIERAKGIPAYTVEGESRLLEEFLSDVGYDADEDGGYGKVTISCVGMKVRIAGAVEQFFESSEFRLMVSNGALCEDIGVGHAYSDERQCYTVVLGKRRINDESLWGGLCGM